MSNTREKIFGLMETMESIYRTNSALVVPNRRTSLRVTRSFTLENLMQHGSIPWLGIPVIL